MPSPAKVQADISARRFAVALAALLDAEERKDGYNPDQPRVPAGNGRESGRWGYLMAALKKLATVEANRAADKVVHEVEYLTKPAVKAALRAAPPEVRRFIEQNQDAIERTVGAVQAVGAAPRSSKASA